MKPFACVTHTCIRIHMHTCIRTHLQKQTLKLSSAEAVVAIYLLLASSPACSNSNLCNPVYRCCSGRLLVQHHLRGRPQQEPQAVRHMPGHRLHQPFQQGAGVQGKISDACSCMPHASYASAAGTAVPMSRFLASYFWPFSRCRSLQTLLCQAWLTFAALRSWMQN